MIILKRIKISMMLLSMSLLHGCTSLNSKFDCPMKNGIFCESLDQINARVNRGEIGNTKTAAKPLSLTTNNVITQPLSRPPVRYGELVQRLWIAPYQDKEGNYHQMSEIFVITRPGHWSGSPVKEIDENN